MRIPIATKLVSMTLILLLAVTVPIALVTSKYFEHTSRQREENINLDLVAARGAEVEGILSNLIEKIQRHGTTILRLTNHSHSDSQDLDVSFMQDKAFYALQVYRVDGEASDGANKSQEGVYIADAYKAKPDQFLNTQTWAHFPFNKVVRGGIQIVNTTFKDGPAMFAIGIPLVKDANGKTTHIAVASIDLSLIQRPFNETAERSFFMIDRDGIELAGSNEEQALARDDLSKNEEVMVAKTSKTPRGQRIFQDPSTNQRNYAGFSKIAYGLTVFSEIPEGVVLEPVREVKRKTWLIAGIALSVSVFLVFVFSISLTAPLERLATLIELVAKGNFDVQAALKARSRFRDEVSDLAVAFDQMTDGLKERDKVKTLFSKFHGSTVTDDLLRGEVRLGGQRKDVIVFFSDIRGFTSFSEDRSPEEVVEMLNEYFGVMVAIINKNGGVVDKFIGDAIMAVWGAPVKSDGDATNALNACLAMRKALAELNEKRVAADKPAILIGMGLHAGTAISGTIGSNERMEYTVIGNTVNTASRIEAATKAFGSDLLISAELQALVGTGFATEYAGEAEVHGRSEALKFFKVLGLRREDGTLIDLKTPYSDYTAESSKKISVHVS